MIRVTYRTDGRRRELIVNGHANYAKKGQDLICAAASILVYTAAQEAREAQERGSLTEPARIRLGQGDAVVSFEASGDLGGDEVCTAFRTIMTGFRILADSYPKNIKVSVADTE